MRHVRVGGVVGLCVGSAPMAVAALILAVCGGRPALGVPASPHSYQVTQPDGTIITLHVRGDEYFHWEEDAERYTVLRNDAGAYVYAALDGQGKLSATKLVVGVDDPRVAGLKPGTLPSRKARKQIRARMMGPRRKGAVAAAVTGKIDVRGEV